jgi:hypothetical protein
VNQELDILLLEYGGQIQLSGSRFDVLGFLIREAAFSDKLDYGGLYESAILVTFGL